MIGFKGWTRWTMSTPARNGNPSWGSSCCCDLHIYSGPTYRFYPEGWTASTLSTPKPQVQRQGDPTMVSHPRSPAPPGADRCWHHTAPHTLAPTWYALDAEQSTSLAPSHHSGHNACPNLVRVRPAPGRRSLLRRRSRRLSNPAPVGTRPSGHPLYPVF